VVRSALQSAFVKKSGHEVLGLYQSSSLNLASSSNEIVIQGMRERLVVVLLKRKVSGVRDFICNIYIYIYVCECTRGQYTYTLFDLWFLSLWKESPINC
jgi:hypothetical protein